MPGPAGVFLYMYDTAQGMRKPAAGRIYDIYKEDGRGGGFKKLATLSFPASSAELEKRIDRSLLQEILQQRKLRSIDDLYMQLKAGRFDTLGFYSNAPSVLAALGVLYIDRKVTGPDEKISYRVEVSGNNPSNASPAGTAPTMPRILYQISLRDIRYSPLPIFKQYMTAISDSAALVTWYAVGGRGAFATVYTNMHEDQFTPSSRLLVYSRKDTFFVTCNMPTIPGSKVLLYVRPEDIAGNKGIPSDTVHLLALSFHNTLAITHLSATDTLGSVWLKWDSLPAKAWCSGIQVLKSRSATGDYIVIDTLPVSARSYRDSKVIGGNVYYYQLRPLLFDLPQHGRISPALVNINVRTKSAREKVAAPQGLSIDLTPEKDIRLSWQPNSELDVFAYYILRGTSPQHMQVISPAIRDTLFIDSAKRLNTGTTYLYAVSALNMDMQWSDTSAPVSIQSPGVTLVTAPAGIMARLTGQGVRLNWNDVALNDATVTGYMLYRRKQGDQYFSPLTSSPVTGTYYTDSSSITAGTYEYGCTAVDAWGKQSILSAVAEVNVVPSSYLYPPAGFSLRNLETGIEISVPPALEDKEAAASPGNGRRYILYRRLVTDKQYHKIAELPAGTSLFVDKQVVRGQLYAYAISLQNDNAESGKSVEKSIRRK
jgi:hypothetical protein